jgi:hypothetical protein
VVIYGYHNNGAAEGIKLEAAEPSGVINKNEIIRGRYSEGESGCEAVKTTINWLVKRFTAPHQNLIAQFEASRARTGEHHKELSAHHAPLAERDFAISLGRIRYR